MSPAAPFTGDLWSRVPPPWRGRLESLAAVLRRDKLSAALVGGCVRDLLLDRVPKDWDVIVEGAPGPAVRAFAKAENVPVKEHPAFLTYALHYNEGEVLDVATARTETYAAPGALPMVRASTLAADAARRDFAVNALYLRLTPERGEIWDPLEGGDDIVRGIVRALHEKSFEDDPTRLYRAARYAGRFGWRVEENTLVWLRQAVRLDRPLAISAVRRRNELFHLLEESDPGPALSLLWEWGLWKFWDEGWVWDAAAAQRLAGAAPALADRLAALLGPDPARAESWLKAAATPLELRRRVTAALQALRPPPDSSPR